MFCLYWLSLYNFSDQITPTPNLSTINNNLLLFHTSLLEVYEKTKEWTFMIATQHH